jgi:hypothetical protein
MSRARPQTPGRVLGARRQINHGDAGQTSGGVLTHLGTPWHTYGMTDTTPRPSLAELDDLRFRAMVIGQAANSPSGVRSLVSELENRIGELIRRVAAENDETAELVWCDTHNTDKTPLTAATAHLETSECRHPHYAGVRVQIEDNSGC